MDKDDAKNLTNDKFLNDLSEEIQANRAKIENEKREEKPGFYDFNKYNRIKEEKISKQNGKEVNFKKTDKKLLIVSLVLIWIITLLISWKFFKYVDYNKNNTKSDTISSTIPKEKMLNSTILAGKNLYNITCNVNDIKVSDGELQIKLSLKNSGENTFYPILGKTYLKDSKNSEYPIEGFIMQDLPTGLKSKEKIDCLLIFNIKENLKEKNFILNLYGSDIEHFTFLFEIPFSV